MELFILIILFVIMGFGTVKLNRALQQRRQIAQSATSAEAGPTATPLATSPNRMVTWLNGAIPKAWHVPDEDQLANQFRAWVETGLIHEPTLQTWLLGLSIEQLQAVVEHVSAYCEQLKVELTWLTEQQSAVPPALKSTTQEIVVGYCTGIWKATQIKSKLYLFTEYQQFTQLTAAQQHQILQRELLARLAAQDLVAIPLLAATLTGTEAERQAKVVQAIQQVAIKDWERFTAIFQATEQNDLQVEKQR
ncbi:MAG: hypothetical protein NT075_14790 [Chloroflexi bacterium]|nr:hypothetical protein [Chloroflexota bacterium]